jgi:PleD family two-component response regulator
MSNPAAKRILIVDDDVDAIVFCERALSREGYDVVFSTEIAEALLILEAAPVDLIILDIVMPKMNGFEFMAIAKRLPGFHGRVLMISSETDANAVFKAASAGASDYLTKPYDKPSLVAKVKLVLGV